MSVRNTPLRALFAIFMALVICLSDVTATVRAMGTYDEIFYSGNNIVWYDSRCNTESTAEIVQLAGKDNTEKILNFFMRKGLSLAQSAGIVGNMIQESGLNPAIIQGGRIANDSYVLESGVGFGLVQWTSGGRQQKFMTHMKGMGVGVTNLSGQLEFVWKEMNESYGHTLRALKATQDPIEAAVAVHGPPSPGYEASADTPAAVRSVRGGNAKKIYQKYNDAPALAGSTATSDMTPAGDGTDADISAAMGTTPKSKDGTKGTSCNELEQKGGSALGRTIGKYAWHTHKGNDIKATPEYSEAVIKAVNEKRYVGGTTKATAGIDCGGFVSLAMQDSGFEKEYNSAKGNTVTQTVWLEAAVKRGTWGKIGPGDTKMTGDVAINADHTYMYVDKKDIPGGDFGTNIASASLDERSPMAGKESSVDDSFSWYRKKG